MRCECLGGPIYSALAPHRLNWDLKNEEENFRFRFSFLRLLLGLIRQHSQTRLLFHSAFLRSEGKRVGVGTSETCARGDVENGFFIFPPTHTDIQTQTPIHKRTGSEISLFFSPSQAISDVCLNIFPSPVFLVLIPLVGCLAPTLV